MMISFIVSEKEIIYLKKKESKRASKISLTANIHGFFLTVPNKLNECNLKRFLDENKNWILKNYYNYKKNNIDYAKKYEDRYLLFFGKKFYLSIVKDDLDTIIVSDSLQKITFHVSKKRNYKQNITNWYKEQTRQIIDQKLAEIGKKMDISYNNVRIKDNSSTWGSCSTKKNLNFNLYLSAFPLDVIEYIVIHELAHIKEFNHSSKFWQIVKEFDPLYKEHIEYIKDYSDLTKL